jgi:hypothetical protein
MATLAFSQNPAFKAFIDSVEIDNQADMSAGVKTTSGYFSIIDKATMKIKLPGGVDLRKIQYFRFTIDQDIIIFPIRKIVDNYETLSKEALEEKLHYIFHSIDKWELHIDNIRYYVGDVIPLATIPTDKNSNYQNFKIYALKTDQVKYYVIKS